MILKIKASISIERCVSLKQAVGQKIYVKNNLYILVLLILNQFHLLLWLCCFYHLTKAWDDVQCDNFLCCFSSDLVRE